MVLIGGLEALALAERMSDVRVKTTVMKLVTRVTMGER